MYKRAFEWTTLDLGCPSTIAAVWFVIVLAAVVGLTWLFRLHGKLEYRGRRMRFIGRSVLLIALSLCTAFAAGPFVWTAMMSVRTTTGIHLGHFAFPDPAHWEKFPEARFNSNYGVCFTNSTQIVLSAVVILTLIGERWPLHLDLTEAHFFDSEGAIL